MFLSTAPSAARNRAAPAAGRLRRHLRDAVAVAVKRARKRGLRAADAVEPADTAVEGLVIVCQRDIRAEQDGLARKGIALLDQLGQARQLPRGRQGEAVGRRRIPVRLGQLRPDLVRRVGRGAQAQ